MKTVCFIRHAKSSWKDLTLADIDRPLNKRGKRDAPFMATLLRGKNVTADLIIASPANRAFTTATYFAETMNIPKTDIVIRTDIYEAYASDVLSIVQGLDNKHQTVFLFGHNPTFTSIANQFSSSYIANVPTCGVVQIEATIDDWSAFSPSRARLVQFYYPKQFFV